MLNNNVLYTSVNIYSFLFIKFIIFIIIKNLEFIFF